MRKISLVAAALGALAGDWGCGVIGPSCMDETGLLLNANEDARAGAERFFDVISPKHSNLVMRLTWTDPNAELAMHAPIIDCGGHVGCSMVTVRPPVRAQWFFARSTTLANRAARDGSGWLARQDVAHRRDRRCRT